MRNNQSITLQKKAHVITQKKFSYCLNQNAHKHSVKFLPIFLHGSANTLTTHLQSNVM